MEQNYGPYQPLATPLFFNTHIHPIFDVMIDVTTYCNKSTPSPILDKCPHPVVILIIATASTQLHCVTRLSFV